MNVQRSPTVPYYQKCWKCRKGDSNPPVYKWIQCDQCDHWFHYHCVQQENREDQREWRCIECNTNNSVDDLADTLAKANQLTEQNNSKAPIIPSIEVQSPVSHYDQSTNISILTPARLGGTIPTFSTSTVPSISLNFPPSSLSNSKPCYTQVDTRNDIPATFYSGHATQTTNFNWPYPSIPYTSSYMPSSAPFAPYIAPMNMPTTSFPYLNMPTTSFPYLNVPMTSAYMQPPQNLNCPTTPMFMQSTQPSVPNSHISTVPTYPSSTQIPLSTTPTPACMQSTSYMQPSMSGHPQASSAHVIPPQVYPMQNPVYPNPMQHFMARQVIKNDLPEFSGKLDEWAMFYASYNQTTSACGYSDAENIHRLRKALKKDALETVKGLLSNPAHVPRIMTVLRQRFGQPEFIVRQHIDRIRNQPAPKADKLETMVQYSITVANLVASIEATADPANLSNPILLQELVDKLPSNYKVQWAQFKLSIGYANVQIFSSWMEQLATAIATVQPYSFSSTKEKIESKSRVNVHTEDDGIKSKTAEVKERTCPACRKPECINLADCNVFKEYTVAGRWTTVKKARLCRYCFAKHMTTDCPTAKPCGIGQCTYNHHRLLHSEKKPRTATAPESLNHQADPTMTMFRVVAVKVKGPSGTLDEYALLDDASSLTFMEQSLQDDMGVQGEPAPVTLKWTDGQHRTESASEKVQIQISPRDGEKYFQFTARTVKRLDLPLYNMNYMKLAAQFSHLRRLPIQNCQQKRPRILIGIDQYNLSVPLKVKEGKVGEPVATKTRLGWCISGKMISNPVANTPDGHYHVCECQHDNAELESLVRDFSSLEMQGIDKRPGLELSVDEKRAETLMKQTLVKKDGRYEVGLLWRYDKFTLPDSKPMAVSRLKCLERQLQRSPDILAKVQEQFDDYLAAGYLREVQPDELKDKQHIWYLPVFPVFSPNKPDRPRIVWDAAAKVSGVSLNSFLLKGPDLYASLLAIILRFRQHKVVFSADVQQMFHRIQIRPIDQFAQLCLWRNCDSSKDPKTYALTVMSFGATSSPYQAHYVVRNHAAEYEGEQPGAVRAILNDQYVDDILHGSDTEENAISLAKQIRNILAEGDFNLRKWHSNSKRLELELNNSTQSPPLDTPFQFADQDGGKKEKVLGIFWNPTSDTLTYSLALNKASKEVLKGIVTPSKRETLRTLMSIYDPPGFLAHFTVGLKILQQELWRHKIAWDQPIPEESNERWKIWLNHLPLIEELHIPRAYLQSLHTYTDCNIQLHTFTDAGEAAYAACCYLRIMNPANEVHVVLVAGKSRPAPIKYVSIPRLELQAAVMGTRLAKTITESLTIPIQEKKYWTDSTTVLHWISSPKKQPVYIAARVGELLESSSPQQWSWVSTHENVADLGTKWRDSMDLSSDSMWFQGPSFLYENSTEWADNPDPEDIAVVLHHEDTYVEPHSINLSHFKDYERMHIMISYVCRFIIRCRTRIQLRRQYVPVRKTSLNLGSEDLQYGEIVLHRIAQRWQFEEEILILSANKPLPRKYKLRRLCPEIDKSGVIRLDGRINAAKGIDDDTKKPIILPKRHIVTRLIIEKIHRECAHQFSETVVNRVRQRYYIASLRTVVKRVERECKECQWRRIQPKPPQMAPLPEERLAIGLHPFTFIGVDVFGYIYVTVNRHKEKRWVILFTCLTIRAVHLEVTDTMSTDGFILCYKNFVHRRGAPRKIICDRGTNFVGAAYLMNPEARTSLEEFVNHKANDGRQILRETTTSTTEWCFLPPHSPHMNGATERLVKSVKSGLEVLLQNDRYPSPSVLQSTLIEMEYIVNSRPLTYVPIQGAEEDAITPNLLLTHRGDTCKPLGKVDDEARAVRHSWQMSQNLAQRFKRAWVRQYLPTLTRRGKWFDKEDSQICVGDEVIIFDETCRRRDWPRGKVVQVFLSRDGIVRSAKVQTKETIIHRPVVKLAKLTIDARVQTKSCTARGVAGRDIDHY